MTTDNKIQGKSFDYTIIDDMVCNKKIISKKKLDKIWNWVKRNFLKSNTKVFPGTPWNKNNYIDKIYNLKEVKK